MASKILWTDQTWNPIIGCSKVSPGCDNCWAERMAARQAAMACGSLNFMTKGIMTDAQKAYTKVAKLWHDPNDERTYWKGWNGKTEFVESPLQKPLHWKKPRMIFVCSMGDLFHESVRFSWIEKVMSVIEECPQHTFQVLTKRPHIMAEYFNGLGKGFELSCLHNLWLGVTAENQEQADIRIPILLQIPAAKRFVFVEPMLGEIKLPYYLTDYSTGSCTLLDWVICGGESGPGARPIHPDWARGLRDQCKEAGVPFMFKQWGEWGNCTSSVTCRSCDVIDRKRRFEWKCANYKTLCSIKVGKKKAGRLLDGVEHNEFPEVTK